MIRRPWLDRRGAAAVEFALIGLPFVSLLVFVMELGYDFFAQVSLDYGTQTAARQVQIGAAQGAATPAVFQASYLCPAVAGLLPCSAVAVNVQQVTSSYATGATTVLPTNAGGQFSTSSLVFCPGQPKQLMLVTAYYSSPTFLGLIVPAMGTASAAGTVHVTRSYAAFINEDFPVTSAPPAGC